MLKKIYLIILYIITGICMLVGFLFHIYGVRDGKVSDIGVASEELDPFTSVKVDTAVMDFTMEYGDTYSLSYECSSSLEPTITMQDDNTLLITQKDNKKLKGNSKCSMTLTIPSDARISVVDITSDVGNVELEDIAMKKFIGDCDIGSVNLSGCSMENNLHLTTDVGDIDISDCKLAEGKIRADVGNIDVSACTFDSFNIESDTGDIKLSGVDNIDAYSLSLKNDLGGITLNGEKHRGEYTKEGSDKNLYITITNNAGNIKVEE